MTRSIHSSYNLEHPTVQTTKSINKPEDDEKQVADALLSESFWEEYTKHLATSAFKSEIAHYLNKTFNTSAIRNSNKHSYTMAEINISTGIGAALAINLLAAGMHPSEEKYTNFNKIINKAAFNGILLHITPLVLPAGLAGSAAFFAVYVAGKTLADIVFDYDKSKSLMENLQSKKHLPFYYAFDYTSLILFPFFTTPLTGATSSLYDYPLLRESVKALYYTTYDKYISAPLTQKITNKILGASDHGTREAQKIRDYSANETEISLDI